MASFRNSNKSKSTNSKEKRVIVLLDMDSFEAQIYKRLYPEIEFWGKPWVVVDETGRIVCATHEARKVGISRDIRLREAQMKARLHKIPLQVFTKPNDREKPDGKEIRYASWEILDSLKEYVSHYAYGVVVEYSSCDEFFLDITEEVNLCVNRESPPLVESRTFLETEQEKISGELLKEVVRIKFHATCQDKDGELENERRLIYGGLIMQNIVNYVFSQTKLIASAGVGSNKLMAKLAQGLNKPNGITVLLDSGLSRVAKEIPIEKIPGFGGVFGAGMKEILNISTMKELANIELDQLEDCFGTEKGIEVYFKARGLSDEPVNHKMMTDSISCGKNFFGQITSDETLKYHLHKLIEEMLDRLDEERFRHKRQPTAIHYAVQFLPIPVENNENKKSWTFHTVYRDTITCDKFSRQVMNAILNDTAMRIDSIKITRIEVRAKGFVT